MTEVLELRQYTLRPGRRDDLIDLFDREFVESQEALGIRLYGQFRDLDDDDRFVWIRGFADLPARAAALRAFYGGPVWREHRDKANDTMIDSDDVLLLRPSCPVALGDRPVAEPTSLVTVTIYHLPPGAGEEFATFFDAEVAPVLTSSGAPPLARLRTETAENNYPALPVRTDANVFAWIASFVDEKQHHDQPPAGSAPTLVPARGTPGRVWIASGREVGGLAHGSRTAAAPAVAACSRMGSGSATSGLPEAVGRP